MENLSGQGYSVDLSSAYLGGYIGRVCFWKLIYLLMISMLSV